MDCCWCFHVPSSDTLALATTCNSWNDRAAFQAVLVSSTLSLFRLLSSSLPANVNTHQHSYMSWLTLAGNACAHSGGPWIFTHTFSCMHRWKMLLLPVLEIVQVEGLNFLWGTLLLLLSLFISSIPLNPFFLSSISALSLSLCCSPWTKELPSSSFHWKPSHTLDSLASHSPTRTLIPLVVCKTQSTSLR